jgi:hypothetical protein
MTKNRSFILSAYLFCFAFTAAGCQKANEGKLERAGEKVDEAIENIKDGENPLKKKGPMEKLGESVDEQVGISNE